MSHILLVLLASLSTASTLFLVASGITLLFGALRVVNIAHGSFVMYGAYILASAAAAYGGEGWQLWVAILAVPLIVGVLGSGMEISVMRRTYGKEHLSQLLATFAMFYIFADLALILWGGSYKSVPVPQGLGGSVVIADLAFPVYSLFVIGVTIAVAVALAALLRFTQFGWQIRAAVEDPELLAVTGVHVRRLGTIVFGLAAGLAGLAGVLIAPVQTIAPGLDASVLVAGFIVAVVGGLGSISGAAVGALVIGLGETLGALWVPALESVMIYVLMIAMLSIRPSGLLGRS